jgi:hypothetical protein
VNAVDLRASDSGVRARLGPERVAFGLVIVLAAAISLSAWAPRLSFGSGAVASPSPALPPTARPESRYDTASIGLILELNQLIGRSQTPLEGALAKQPLDVLAIRSELSGIVVNVRLGLDVAAKLASQPESRTAGKHATTYYEGLRAIADRSFQAALANEVVHRRAAQAMIAALGKRGALDDELKALLRKAEAELASPKPATTASPVPPAASPSPAVSTPSARSSRGSGSVPGDLVVNGSFEDGPSPWQLTLRDPAAVARSSVDGAVARTGLASLRIEISAGSDSRSAIAVEQAGLSIAGDSRYTVRMYAQAQTPREIRVAVRSSTGATYGGRVFAIGSTWTALEFAFTALTADDSATLEVDLGRSTATVWLDAITVVRQAG